MTPEEKQAIISLLGETYRVSLENDKSLVNQTPQLKPISNNIKQNLEEVLKQPVQLPHNNTQLPTALSPITPQLAVSELAQLQTHNNQQPVIAPTPDSQQLELNFNEPTKLDVIIDLLKRQNLILDKISLSLQNEQNTSAKQSNRVYKLSR